MKNLSRSAKLRISPLKAVRSNHMADLARTKWSSMTPEARQTLVNKMIAGRQAKRQAKLSQVSN